MGLEDDSILTWDDMKWTFLKKYHDYCKNRNSKEYMFSMQQKEDENLEDFVERLFCIALKRLNMQD